MMIHGVTQDKVCSEDEVACLDKETSVDQAVQDTSTQIQVIHDEEEFIVSKLS